MSDGGGVDRQRLRRMVKDELREEGSKCKVWLRDKSEVLEDGLNNLAADDPHFYIAADYTKIISNSIFTVYQPSANVGLSTLSLGICRAYAKLFVR